jgi:ribonuclease VapC
VRLFVDASAIVAMIAREPEAASFGAFLRDYQDRMTSPIAVWEAARAVARVRRVDFTEARTLVADFLDEARLKLMPIDAAAAEIAMDAHQRYGKGNDVAGLNMGDCFAYAVASQYKAEILFKGEDFIHTDLRDASLP